MYWKSMLNCNTSGTRYHGTLNERGEVWPDFNLESGIDYNMHSQRREHGPKLSCYDLWFGPHHMTWGWKDRKNMEKKIKTFFSIISPVFTAIHWKVWGKYKWKVSTVPLKGKKSRLEENNIFLMFCVLSQNQLSSDKHFLIIIQLAVVHKTPNVA